MRGALDWREPQNSPTARMLYGSPGATSIKPMAVVPKYGRLTSQGPTCANAPLLGAAFCDGTESTGCRGRGSNRPGKHLVSSIADRRMEVQSSGAARAAVTTLITSAVAAMDVLLVRMGVSSHLLHYARSTAGCSRSQGG